VEGSVPEGVRLEGRELEILREIEVLRREVRWEGAMRASLWD
jgi:hypothetical protein